MARKKSADTAAGAPDEATPAQTPKKKPSKAKKGEVAAPIVAAPAAPPRAVPTREAIAERARALYRAGSLDAFANWLRAERDLGEKPNEA